MLIISLLFLSLCVHNKGFIFEEKYKCGICLDVFNGIPCEYFDACHVVNRSVIDTFGTCENATLCDPIEPLPLLTAPSVLDVRVTKGFGTKDYSAVRVSVVTKRGETPPFNTSDFEYSAPFKYRWTDNVLHSSIMSLKAGQNKINIGNTSISVWLPKQGNAVAGLLLADPCVHLSTTHSWVGCSNAEKFKTSQRLPEMLHAIMSDTDTDFWSILGDNFYDRTGEITRAMYDNFTLATKSKMMITVAGNHDYWVMGTPGGGTTADQYANGHMQWYAMDSKAAEKLLPQSNYELGINPQNIGVPPFDFSIDPSSKHPGALPMISNAFWYQQIGNIGIVGYSGGYTYKELAPYVEEACSWLGHASAFSGVKMGLLVGHWDKTGMGCAKEMSVPEVYDEIAKFDGCKQMADKKLLKFIMGHTHCNVPHPHGHVDTGFMVAGQGMSGCDNYGFPIVDTTENRIRFWHFEVVSKSGKDTYNEVFACISKKGWRQCTDMAELWLDQPFPTTE